MKISIMLLLFLSAGCLSEASRNQSAADAFEGVDAMALVSPDTLEIGRGVQTNILATRGMTSVQELPRPQMTAQRIVDNPALYQQQADHNMQRSKGLSWAALAVVGGGIIVAALKALGIGGPLLEVVKRLMETSKQREERCFQEGASRLGIRAVREIERLPEDQGKPIKKVISHGKDHDPEQEKVIRRVLGPG